MFGFEAPDPAGWDRVVKLHQLACKERGSFKSTRPVDETVRSFCCPSFIHPKILLHFVIPGNVSSLTRPLLVRASGHCPRLPAVTLGAGTVLDGEDTAFTTAFKKGNFS